MKYLIVVDMQVDFISGSLGSDLAKSIVENVVNKVKSFDGTVIFTRDTHTKDYMNTQEGRNLPVPHCIKGTEGWQIRSELDALRATEAIDKITFGSTELIDVIGREENVESITFVGLCTDICVISNVMTVKAFYPEIPLIVDARGCAGVTPESHRTALSAMKMCQVAIENEG